MWPASSASSARSSTALTSSPSIDPSPVSRSPRPHPGSAPAARPAAGHPSAPAAAPAPGLARARPGRHEQGFPRHDRDHPRPSPASRRYHPSGHLAPRFPWSRTLPLFSPRFSRCPDPAYDYPVLLFTHTPRVIPLQGRWVGGGAVRRPGLCSAVEWQPVDTGGPREGQAFGGSSRSCAWLRVSGVVAGRGLDRTRFGGHPA